MEDTRSSAGPVDRGPIDWSVFGMLAPVLLYPTERFPAMVRRLREELRTRAPEILEGVEASFDIFESLPIYELEELYTQTFDLNPVCTLEVGWHLYGEQYERGRFLVRTRELLTDVGLDEGGELPDFLPSLLMALPLSSPQEASDIAAYLIPALRKMCTAMEDKGLTGKAEVYHPILRSVRDALEARVPAESIEEAESRFRPELQGGRLRGIDPGPNGDFPIDAPGASASAGNAQLKHSVNGSQVNGSDVNAKDRLIKLGVNKEMPPEDGSVWGIPVTEVPRGAAEKSKRGGKG